VEPEPKPVTTALPIPDEAFRAFKRDLYDDAVSDWTGLWEVALTVAHRFPELAGSEVLQVAEAAVGQLVSAQLAELYRNQSAATTGWVDPDPIPPNEYESVLRDWHSWLSSTDSFIWIAGDEPADRETRQSILNSL
jgi:hypothetical protein